ncbi:MAG: hypothetical protein ACJA04_000625 [Cellvibrionaceae bacterium]|jgi:hypothetical protein
MDGKQTVNESDAISLPFATFSQGGDEHPHRQGVITINNGQQQNRSYKFLRFPSAFEFADFTANPGNCYIFVRQSL